MKRKQLRIHKERQQQQQQSRKDVKHDSYAYMYSGNTQISLFVITVRTHQFCVNFVYLHFEYAGGACKRHAKYQTQSNALEQKL